MQGLSTELEQYLVIKGFVATLPEEDQTKIQDCAKAIKAAMAAYRPEIGTLAMALVGGEMAVKQDLL